MIACIKHFPGLGDASTDAHYALPVVKRTRDQLYASAKGAGAWLGLGALVMPGVTVGEGAVIGARSVLTRDAQPWTVYVGQPARAVGSRELRDDTASVQRSSNATES